MDLNSPACVPQYLMRVKFPGFEDAAAAAPLPPPTVETLTALHRGHTLHISFENLSLSHPKLKAPVPNDIESLWDKLVLRRRGGWCYEMNGVLHHVLRLLGYDCWDGVGHVVTAGSLQQRPPPAGGVPTFRDPGSTIDVRGLHRIVMMRIDGDIWLADVGFGGQGLLEPVQVRAYDDGGKEWAQAGTRYRLRRGVMGSAELLPAAMADTHPEAASHVGWYLQVLLKGTWADVYFFTTEAAIATEFEAFAHYTASFHPMFSKQMLAAKPTDTGRFTLLDMTLKERRGDASEARQLASAEERDEVLREVFGLDIPK
ncbi:MAG: hypothetical protein J3K34DRAFT_428644 [Monoraphidium minutum]|nr:MAG: hypothetical protein J3K34DRAFT_428644 [Monoraphidium minutum]